MADASAWMPLYVGDYLGDTQRLTTEQHGAYFLLLIDYWRNGAPPNDDAVLAQITRMERADWQRIKRAILKFFDEQDGLLIHGRVERELEKAKANVEKRVERAKAAAEARWHSDAPSTAASNARRNARSNARRMPEAMPEDMLEECPSPSPTDKSVDTRTKHLLPDGWEPQQFGEKSQSRAIVDSWSRVELERQLEAFKAHHRSKRSRWADWQDTWSTWVLNSVRFSSPGAHRQPTNTNGDLVETILAEANRGRADPP